MAADHSAADDSAADHAAAAFGALADHGPTDVVVSDDELRLALELALGFAKAGVRQRPPLPVSGALRELFAVRKVDAASLRIIRRELERDGDLRARVAAIATAALAGGELPLLWLTRPENWEQRIVDLRVDALVSGKPVDASSDRDRRRLDAATTAARELRLEVEHLKESVRAERDRRRQADAAHAETRRLLDAALERAAQAERAIEKVHNRLESTERRLERVTADLGAANADRAAAVDRLDAALADRAAALFGDAGEGLPPAFASKLRSLKSALDSIGQDVGALEALMTPAARTPSPQRSSTVTRSAPAARERVSRRRSSRQPIGMPGGVFSDTAEATEYLLRFPGVAVVVDGYNVAKQGWPGLTLEQQRDALLDALDAGVRRLGTRIVVVFDGADVGAPASGRRLMSVLFTAEGWSADDEIRRLAEALPDATPLVVVTDDRQILTDVRPMGANPMRSADLLAALRR